MNIRKLLDRRAGYALSSIGLLLGIIAPSAFPILASADAQVTSRSMQLSSSAAAATGVDYKLTFTPATTEATGYVVVFFCNDSPIIGQTCTTPTGLVTTSATSAPAGVTATTNGRFEISQALTAATPVTITFSGITNPTNVTDATVGNGFYARVQTYANSTDAGNVYTTGGPTSTTGIVDDGGIAMAITSSINVSAAVRETMTFCVSGQVPNADCGKGLVAPVAGAVISPSLTLGEGTPKALDSGHVSTGDDWAQLSTNAATGAIVNMSTSVSCGGLSRSSAPTTCDIAPQTATTGTAPRIILGSPLFGVMLSSATPATGAATPSGTLAPVGSYSTTSYFMDYNSSTPTTAGVTSPYGSQIFSSSSAPVNNQNIQMTFGASVSNTTPAGLYSATLNLVATGTF